jgi:hypothetical protein
MTVHSVSSTSLLGCHSWQADGDILRWTRKFGQAVKLGLLLRRTDLNDGQAEAVFGGFQGEGCS